MRAHRQPWDNWIKDPKKAEKIYLFYKFLVIGVNVLLFFGFAFFIFLLVTRKGTM